ncbi:SUMF1/EgtB/PvdO family nonheme iron enzyme [Verrucomicrobiota bacterium]
MNKMKTTRLLSILILLFYLLPAYVRPEEAPTYIAEFFSVIRSNDIQRTEWILENSKTGIVNSVISYDITPLHIAAAKNHTSIARLLVSHGANVNARTPNGFTPLHWASGRNATETMQLLIESNADINAGTISGITPLHWAAGKNATNALRLLILSGADLRAKTKKGASPLHWALMKDANEAGIMLAYKTVSNQMEQEEDRHGDTATRRSGERSETKSLKVDKHEVAEPEATEAHPSFPTPTPGMSLTVPLGMSETLVFVWIKDLNAWVGKYEVTNSQYRRFKPNHNSMFYEDFTLNKNEQPVVYVSWKDAKEYCKWLNQNFSGKIPLNCIFRLPTGKEWISFAKCGDDRKFPWGNKWPPKYGNFSDLTAREKLIDWTGIEQYEDGYPVTCPVTESGVNEWGIYGLAGNVWEWCEDWHDDTKTHKVRHGGSWYFDGQSDLCIDHQGFDRPDSRYDTIGFRVVISGGK